MYNLGNLYCSLFFSPLSFVFRKQKLTNVLFFFFAFSDTTGSIRQMIHSPGRWARFFNMAPLRALPTTRLWRTPTLWASPLWDLTWVLLILLRCGKPLCCCLSLSLHERIYTQLALGERRGTPWTGRQSIKGPFTGSLESPVNLHVFGLWEEAGISGENPRRHEENMQTPHRKTPADRWVRTQNPLAVRRQCCSNRCTTVPPNPVLNKIQIKWKCFFSAGVTKPFRCKMSTDIRICSYFLGIW